MLTIDAGSAYPSSEWKKRFSCSWLHLTNWSNTMAKESPFAITFQ